MDGLLLRRVLLLQNLSPTVYQLITYCLYRKHYSPSFCVLCIFIFINSFLLSKSYIKLKTGSRKQKICKIRKFLISDGSPPFSCLFVYSRRTGHPGDPPRLVVARVLFDRGAPTAFGGPIQASSRLPSRHNKLSLRAQGGADGGFNEPDGYRLRRGTNLYY